MAKKSLLKIFPYHYSENKMGRIFAILLLLFTLKGYSSIQDLKCEESNIFSRLEEIVCQLQKVQKAISENEAENAQERTDLYFLFAEKARLIEGADNMLLAVLQKMIPLDDPLKDKKILLVHTVLIYLYKLQSSAEYTDFETMRNNLSALKKTYSSPILKGYQRERPRYKHSPVPCPNF